jgi:cytidine deaminase
VSAADELGTERTTDDDALARLRETARSAGGMNWSPYTRFAVCAAVLAADGRHFGGSNIENANISLSRHAEEVAVINAIAQGALPASGGLDRRKFIRALYTTAPPCGSCRQFVLEFATDDCIVYIDDGDDGATRIPLDVLMPYRFGPEHQQALVDRGPPDRT